MKESPAVSEHDDWCCRPNKASAVVKAECMADDKNHQFTNEWLHIICPRSVGIQIKSSTLSSQPIRWILSDVLAPMARRRDKVCVICMCFYECWPKGARHDIWANMVTTHAGNCDYEKADILARPFKHHYSIQGKIWFRDKISFFDHIEIVHR